MSAVDWSSMPWPWNVYGPKMARQVVLGIKPINPVKRAIPLAPLYLRFRAWRKLNGITQVVAAQRVSCTRRTLIKFEQGLKVNIALQQKIDRLLGSEGRAEAFGGGVVEPPRGPVVGC